MPHRTRAHQPHPHGAELPPHDLTPLDQAMIENSELKLLLFKTFATLSTYASGFADGGAQARKTLDMLHHRMYVGGAHDHHHDDDHDEDDEKATPSANMPKRHAS